jgi:NADH pyrophosphatase NudC (nudix superfamily)
MLMMNLRPLVRKRVLESGKSLYTFEWVNEEHSRALADQYGCLSVEICGKTKRRAIDVSQFAAKHDSAVASDAQLELQHHLSQSELANGCDRSHFFSTLCERVHGGAQFEASLRVLHGFAQLESDAEMRQHLDLLAAARSLIQFHATHSFCGKCGAKTEVRQVDDASNKQRVCVEPSCAHVWFPRSEPAAIMLVVDRQRDRALLGRQPHWPAQRWSTLAGFVDAGESLESAVAREVYEESGIDVDLDTLAIHGTEPWAFPHSLMLGCIVDAQTFDIRVDNNELEDARWWTRHQLADALDGSSDQIRVPPKYAIANRLIDSWVHDQM